MYDWKCQFICIHIFWENVFSKIQEITFLTQANILSSWKIKKNCMLCLFLFLSWYRHRTSANNSVWQNKHRSLFQKMLIPRQVWYTTVWFSNDRHYSLSLWNLIKYPTCFQIEMFSSRSRSVERSSAKTARKWERVSNARSAKMSRRN